ncbi:MAG TPA: D-hexose-6-phosphate mutarotase [Tepidisphaeraceae bacterium]|jgi:glucose-6-phosphate 1-epimerase|nr:D-hexose-6-phosphate mutarotase [Tepidisphaeraceae bacterium]
MSESANLAALQQKFNLPGRIQIERGNGGLTKLTITAPSAAAEIYLHGAHVTHYQPTGHAPVLMMSRKSLFQADKPIRGGVPICWPWFGPREGAPDAPMHGFARVLEWEIESITPTGDTIAVALSLRDSDATKKWWPHKFHLRYVITVGPALTLSFVTNNTCEKPFTFTQALHPYFAISDIRNISVTGLENTSYAERIYQPEVQKQGGEAIRFTRRTDRVYYDTRGPLTIHDPGLKRAITESKEGSKTTVVWNPWSEWPKTVPDFEEDEWPVMVCVEPSNAHQFNVTLKPGESHLMRSVVQVKADQ